MVQYGPASTRPKSAITMPLRGPAELRPNAEVSEAAECWLSIIGLLAKFLSIHHDGRHCYPSNTY
jgi:hypothetical protein